FLLALELLPRREHAFWAAGAFSLHPFIIPFNVYVLQEPLLLCVTTWALLFSVRLLKSASRFDAVLCGVLWGICILGKAVAWFGPFLLFLFLLRRAVKPALLMLALALITVLPWTARNYAVLGRFVPVNDQGAGALEWYIARGAHAAAGGGEFVAELHSKNLPEEEYRKELLSFIVERPTLVFKQSLTNALRFTQLDREWYGKMAGLSMRWYYWVLPFLALQLPLYMGFALSLRVFNVQILFLGAFYLLYWLQYALYWGEPRFAVPVYPVLLCLGVYGLLSSYRRKTGATA
ncbi:MAG TPA: hypothetical protein PLL10_07905, partial [Elusimicrobiales bacterium]|nr:hypothetical protein [Elusimicrobiales bacterium]